MFNDRNLSEVLTSESTVIAGFLVFSTYTFIETYSFAPRVAKFPRMMAGFVIVSSILLLARPYLPAILQPLVASSDRGIGGGMENLTDVDGDEPDSGVEERKVSSRDSAISAGLIGGYTVLSLLIGLLWVTPLFVVVYSIWFGQSRITTAGLVALTFGIGMTFMVIFNMDLASGILT